MTARECLEHPWVLDDDIYVDMLQVCWPPIGQYWQYCRLIGQELETFWMRRCLARRRWHRALNALKAMHTMKKLTFPCVVPGTKMIQL